MPHWKTILTYDGTSYNGWQIQPALPTIQGTLAQAIQRVTGETVLPQGAGRTDTGVHALGQVATFSLSGPIPGPNLHRALNRALPASIRVLSVEPVPNDFHARHNARRKTYEYRILPGDRICSPMLAPYLWACRMSVELTSLQYAAAYILGTHDFTSFAATDPDLTTRTAQVESSASSIATSVIEPTPTAPRALDNPSIPTDNTRTIFHSAWVRQDDIFIYRVIGSGFLHHMVRNLVGTFVQAATNRLNPHAIPEILAARDRSAAGPTAPARGLFLVEVEY